MKVLEKKTSSKGREAKATYDPALDNLPVPRIALEKTEKAREFLKKHPIPEHLLRK